MTKTRNFIFKFSIPIPIPSETFKISTLDISSSINKIIQSKWKIREDPPTITKKKKKRSQLIFVVIIEHDEVSADSWFADPSGKRWGWFVRDHVPWAEARQRSTVSSPWRPVSGVLEQHATGTVHHLGNEHRRAGAEPAISLLILVLVVFAVEIAALTVQASAVVAHLASDAPLFRHRPVQLFARLVKDLGSFCSIILARRVIPGVVSTLIPLHLGRMLQPCLFDNVLVRRWRGARYRLLAPHAVGS